MNIVVCVKQVVDPDAPAGCFQIDPSTKELAIRDAAQVTDPYGEYAVEAALRLKAATGAKVTVLTLGTGLIPNVVKKPLAMGADELILLEDEAFAGVDGYATAFGLAQAIRKLGSVDLVLAGREASDTGAGQTGPGIAELLGVPCVTLAKQIDVEGDRVRVHRMLSDGYEVVTAPLPAVVTVSNELGEPRYPTMKGIMAAKKVQPGSFKPADVGFDSSLARRTKAVRVFKPVYGSRCELVGGETAEDKAENLANRMREAKIL